VRGYLESAWLGDTGGAATIELRTPEMANYLQGQLEKSGRGLKDRKVFNNWRLFTFVDAGAARIHSPDSEQDSHKELWSYAVGTTFKTFDALNGMLALAVPQVSDDYKKKDEPRFLFRVWGEF